MAGYPNRHIGQRDQSSADVTLSGPFTLGRRLTRWDKNRIGYNSSARFAFAKSKFVPYADVMVDLNDTYSMDAKHSATSPACMPCGIRLAAVSSQSAFFRYGTQNHLIINMVQSEILFSYGNMLTINE
ncbi:hypothetical protein LE191_03720 [Janthinobacterium sp. HSC-3S05]|uniref:hypothetical protein n=1 Tax=Janthinobacterium lividum TaxID=29581 RepID=UPI001CD89FCE|nr:hypothetical protein [Janthinobacterium lividum]MCA1859221.1 hypothetical protein [Janthinobacterium lividum]